MDDITHYPLLLSVLAFAAMYLGVLAGLWLQRRHASSGKERSEDLELIIAATLTLLALVIGFTFSMATDRYDERKGFEVAEANAIGKEFLRVDVLPAPDAATARKLLVAYLDQRIAFYTPGGDLAQINRRTDQLQAALWTAVRDPVAARPTEVTALALAGMNDVFDSRGDSQAAMWNRIPIAAWLLMAAIALSGSVLLGYGSRRMGRGLALVLPLIVSISFLLIADLDSPRHGMIEVKPDNLHSLAQSLVR